MNYLDANRPFHEPRLADWVREGMMLIPYYPSPAPDNYGKQLAVIAWKHLVATARSTGTL
jgi:hypothetical protein